MSGENKMKPSPNNDSSKLHLRNVFVFIKEQLTLLQYDITVDTCNTATIYTRYLSHYLRKLTLVISDLSKSECMWLRTIEAIASVSATIFDLL